MWPYEHNLTQEMLLCRVYAPPAGHQFFYGQTNDGASADDRNLQGTLISALIRRHTIASPSDYKIWSRLCIPVSQSNRHNTGLVS
jgi:hypothetical protein